VEVISDMSSRERDSIHQVRARHSTITSPSSSFFTADERHCVNSISLSFDGEGKAT